MVTSSAGCGSWLCVQALHVIWMCRTQLCAWIEIIFPLRFKVSVSRPNGRVDVPY